MRKQFKDAHGGACLQSQLLGKLRGSVLRIEPRALNMAGKYPTTELYSLALLKRNFHFLLCVCVCLCLCLYMKVQVSVRLGRHVSSSELPDVAAGDELWSSAGAICTLNQ